MIFHKLRLLGYNCHYIFLLFYQTALSTEEKFPQLCRIVPEFLLYISFPVVTKILITNISAFTINRSRLRASNFAHLILNANSTITLNNSEWRNYYTVYITGHAINDRITINNSFLYFRNIDSLHQTIISSGNPDVRWAGLFFNNCQPVNSQVSHLRGSISGIRTITIRFSRMNIERTSISNINELLIRDLSVVNLRYMDYIDNDRAIYIHNSNVNANEVTIKANRQHGVVFFNNHGFNHWYDVLISGNVLDGVRTTGSNVLFTNVVLSSNTRFGIHSSGPTRPLIRCWSSILENGQDEVIARVPGFPWFQARVGTPLVHDSFHPGGHTFNLYLFFLLDAYNGSLPVGNLTIDRSNPSRFWRHLSNYAFHPNQPSSAALFDLAVTALFNRDYSDAQSILEGIVTLYPNTTVARHALAFLPTLNNLNNSRSGERFSYLDGIDHANLQDTVREIKALSMLDDGNYYEAYQLYETIRRNASDRVEQLFAEKSQAYSYFRMAEAGSYSLPANARRTPISFEEFREMQEEIMEEIIIAAREARLKEIDDLEPEELAEEELVFGSSIFPNPFNPETTISFTLPTNSEVSIVVYNVRGQRVRTLVDETLARGHHSVVWDGTNDFGRSVGSGIYLYRIVANENMQIRRMMMLK